FLADREAKHRAQVHLRRRQLTAIPEQGCVVEFDVLSEGVRNPPHHVPVGSLVLRFHQVREVRLRQAGRLGESSLLSHTTRDQSLMDQSSYMCGCLNLTPHISSHPNLLA